MDHFGPSCPHLCVRSRSTSPLLARCLTLPGTPRSSRIALSVSSSAEVRLSSAEHVAKHLPLHSQVLGPMGRPHPDVNHARPVEPEEPLDLCLDVCTSNEREISQHGFDLWHRVGLALDEALSSINVDLGPPHQADGDGVDASAIFVGPGTAAQPGSDNRADHDRQGGHPEGSQADPVIWLHRRTVYGARRRRGGHQLGGRAACPGAVLARSAGCSSSTIPVVPTRWRSAPPRSAVA